MGGHRAEDYEHRRRHHVSAYQARMGEAVEQLTWPLSRRQSLRDERLRALVRIAQERSP